MTPLYLVIHHTATDRDTTTFASVKSNHINKGWGDIGYHFFITTNRCHTGRGETEVGAHCRADGMNFKSLGICLTGNFQVQIPTNWQVSRLEKLVRSLQNKYNIPNNRILAHREVKNAATACPGKNLIPIIEELRGGLSMSDEYKGLDLNNKESMKVAVDIWDKVVNKKLYVTKEKHDKLQNKYSQLSESTEVRIKAEDGFKEELSKLLGVSPDGPKILENVAELLAKKEPAKKTEVKESRHSKICRGLASVGL